MVGNNDGQYAIDAMAKIAVDPACPSSMRTSAFFGLINAGAIPELAVIALEPDVPDSWMRGRAARAVSEFVERHLMMRLTPDVIEKVLKIHAQEEQRR